MKKNRKIFIIKTLIILVLVLINVLFKIVEIRETSMSQTLNEKDLVLVNKWPRIEKINRNDIVLVNLEVNSKNVTVVKRVIGLSFDQIEIVDDIFYVNKEKLETPYIKCKSKDIFIKYKKIKLKKDEIFIIGDNQEDSYDSRYFGPIKVNKIRGKVLFKIYPFDIFNSLN